MDSCIASALWFSLFHSQLVDGPENGPEIEVPAKHLLQACLNSIECSSSDVRWSTA